MTEISFRVDGDFPPKKDGAKSMWDKPLEATRLVKLRRATLNALAGRQAFRRNIRVELEVYVGRTNSRSVGDLDNFVTGICDGLMAAHPRAALDATWAADSMQDIHPRYAIAISDDSEVVSIFAKKLTGKSDKLWYRITVGGE